MVYPLNLARFYGSSLPRPRIYPDPKFNATRVDPPAPVNDALLTWASDAHWSMGGLSFKRMRMQGKIEGNIRRLRAAQEEESSRERQVSEKEQTDSPSKIPRKKSLEEVVLERKRKARQTLGEVTPIEGSIRRLRAAQEESSQQRQAAEKKQTNSPSRIPRKKSLEEVVLEPKRKARSTLSEVTPDIKEELPKVVPEIREKTLPRRSGTTVAPPAEVLSSKRKPTRGSKDTTTPVVGKSNDSSHGAASGGMPSKSKTPSRSVPAKKATVRRALLKEELSDNDGSHDALLTVTNRRLRRSSRLQAPVLSSDSE